MCSVNADTAKEAVREGLRSSHCLTSSAKNSSYTLKDANRAIVVANSPVEQGRPVRVDLFKLEPVEVTTVTVNTDWVLQR